MPSPILFLHFPLLLCSTTTTSMVGGHQVFLQMNGDYPWTYDNDLFGGPDFWGLMHQHWHMCKQGKLQSPINIDPAKLIFDPQLGPLRIGRAHLEADLWNTGQFPLLVVNSTTNPAATVNITGGPAHPYTYQVHQAVLHFGNVHRGERGSEHTLDRVRFPAEVQLLAFNADLYANFSEAQHRQRGLLGISVIIDVGEQYQQHNPELHRLTQTAQHVRHRNQVVHVRRFQPAALVSQTDYYVTYEGSLTFPGCFETVTWVIYNSPIYIGVEGLARWAELVQNEADKEEPSEGPEVPLSSNFRPLKASNGRPVRTNINVRLKSTSPEGGQCASKMYVDMGYRTNPARQAVAETPPPPVVLLQSPPSAASRKTRRSMAMDEDDDDFANLDLEFEARIGPNVIHFKDEQ